MAMAEIEPETPVLGCGTDYREHLRHAGASATPRLSFNRFAEREKRLRHHCRVPNLPQTGLRVEAVEFRSGQHPYAAVIGEITVAFATSMNGCSGSASQAKCQ